MIKNYIAFICVIFLLSISIIIYGKSSINHVNQEQLSQAIYTNNSDYTFTSMGYDSVTLEDKEIDLSAENLFSYSDLVLIIEPSDSTEYLGKSIRNKCKVNKVIKGEYNASYINIQNFVLNWSQSNVEYFGNLAPLKQGEEYLVFLSTSKYSINQDDYFFASYTYGHINIHNSDFLVWSNPVTIKEAEEYDCLFNCEQTDNKELESYKLMISEILNQI